MEYFPELAPANAVKRLNNCIKNDRELSCLLNLYGYKPRSRRLTHRQVRILRQYL